MKRKRSLLLSSLMLFAFVMVLTASKPVQAKKVTTYVQTSSKEYRNYDSKFQLMWKTTSKYDKNGNQIAYSSTNYYSSRKGKTTKYKYVYKKNLVQKEYCNNKLNRKYSYDKKGNILKYKYYNNGKLTGVSTNTYKKGKLVSSVTKKGKRKTNESTYYSNGKVKQFIWYDEEGRVESKVSYNKNGNGSTTYYRYDENGTQIVQGTSTNKVTYKKGVLVKSDTTDVWYGYDENEEASTTKYQFTYYASGYRSGWVKTERYTSSDGTVTGTDYSYKADSTGKNVAVQTGKDMKSKKVVSKCKYTYKKITTTVK